MNIYKRYKTWYVRYEINGRLVRRSTHLHDRKAAEGVLATLKLARTGLVERPAIEAALDEIYGTATPKRGTDISSAWEVYEATASACGLDRLAASTTRLRKLHLAHLVAWISREMPAVTTLEAIDGVVAAAYAAHLKSVGKADKTRVCTLGDLTTVWTVLQHALPSIRSNPWKGLRPRVIESQTRPPFSPDELLRVMDAAKNAGHDWTAVCTLALHTGLRYGDCATMKRSQIDLERGIIDVTPIKTVRHGVVVVLPIERTTLLPILREIMARPVRDDADEYLFREHAMYYPRSMAHKMSVPFNRVLAAAGLNDGRHTFHSFRHTFRTRLAEAGVSTATAKMLCGHTTDEMSARYDHSQHLEELTDAVEKAASV